MTQREILEIVQGQLAIDMNCSVDDLNGEKDVFVFVEARENAGRRPFPRGEQHFEMLSMGKGIVVSATAEILEIVKPEFEGKERDEAFSMPFVYGHSLYYLPDMSTIRAMDAPDGFEYELVEREGMEALYKYEGFHHAVSYDVGHARPDVVAVIAKQRGRIVGMAGASEDCAKMWQVGIDVLPECRGGGVAAYLVNRITLEILRRGFVPYYGTASSNIASQRVAHRAGYMPGWVCAYRGRFEGRLLSPTS